MRVALDLLYLVGLALSSPWLIYRALKSRDGRDSAAAPEIAVAATGAIWLHGSSVGEVRLLEPLISLLERKNLPLLISSHTATGFRAARIAFPEHYAFRFPADFSFVQRRLMRRLQPKLIVIVESDLWPNQLLAAERYGVPVAVVNAKLSERSFRLHKWTRLVPRALRKVALIAAQNETHAERFVRLGVPGRRVVVTGNMKYDLTADPLDRARREALRQRLGFGDDACVIIGGSLHAGEDQDLVAAFVATKPLTTRLIIVPRYPDQAAGVMLNLSRHGLGAVAKSALDADPSRKVGDAEVVVVDTLGELRQFYAAADIAFVGGSLYYRGSNKGGHNLMEPAILGLPVVFGPHNYSFKETVADLLSADAGIQVRDRGELEATLVGLAGSPSRRAEIGARARRVVIEGRGASERNFELLLGLFDSSSGCSAQAERAQCRHQPQTQAVNE